MTNSCVTERLVERRYRLMQRLPFVWRFALNKGTWAIVEVIHLLPDGTVIES
jgi:hypothetical protein